MKRRIVSRRARRVKPGDLQDAGRRRRPGLAFPMMGILAGAVFQSLETRAAEPAAVLPENLAVRAVVSASAQYSAEYAPRFAVDGRIAEPETFADPGQAWCAPMKAGGAPLEFKLEWPRAETVAEIVYFGRTGALMSECFKDYEVFLDDDPQPAVKGTFAMEHGPQRVPVAPRPVKTIRLRFLSCHGGPNPGAAEIAVYASRPADEQLAKLCGGESGSHELRDRLLAGGLGFGEILVVKRHPLSTSHVYTYHAEGFRPGGGLYVFSPATGKLRQLVDAGAGEIIDGDLSYDGREAVFSWKRKGKPQGSIAHLPGKHCTDLPDENYQVFRINVDGTGLTQLTDGPSNNLNPCWLPDGGIAFISDRKTAFAYCFVSTSPILHRMARDGSEVERLTSSYLMDFTPAVLPDGRILYTRWEYVDRPAIPIQSLWAIRPDGTGLSGFFGNRVLDPGTFMQARPIPGGDRVLCLLTAHNGDPRGAIGVLDIARGGNAQEAIRNLTPEVNIGRVDRGDGNILVNKGPYETPYPVDARHFLVSKRGSIQLRALDGEVPPSTILPRAGDGMGFYSPIPVRPRARPPVLARQKLDAEAGPWAEVFLADVYNGLEPQVKRGEVKQVCVVEEVAKEQFAPLFHDGVPGAHGYAANTAFGFQFPLVSCGATYAPKKVWGFADVAPDGSASFKVPAGVPVYFLALDAQGRAVQRMRTFTHFKPGEKQSCGGCHADRNYLAGAPRNQVATRHTPQELVPPAWGVKGFSYREVVQPVLDRHCVECHHPRQADGGVDLSGDLTDFFNVSYDYLARKGTFGERNAAAHGVAPHREGRNPWTSWISTINGTEYNVRQIEPKTWGSPASKLADILLAGHPDAAGKPRVQVDEAGRRRVMTWIDLNVPYYPNSSSKNLKAMGCRRVFPVELDDVLKKVAAARCDSCHAKGVPRDFFIRIEKPDLNSFLLAPLAKSAGGTEKCGKPVFSSTADPDYQAILKTFEPVATALRESPREDMPEWKPDAPDPCIRTASTHAGGRD